MSLERIVIDNIKRIRKERNISQEKLAEECGTSTSYIGLMETYRNTPKLSTIERIADALGVAPQVLFQDETADGTEGKSRLGEKARKQLKNKMVKDFESELDKILSLL